MSALDAAAIVAALAPATRACLREVEVVASIDSTNAELMRRGVAGCVLLAEAQSAGRGRRGKVWTSPEGANLCLSLSWRVKQPVGLSLAMGIACAQALRDARVRVKWPNDLVAEGRKLGGLLIELAGPVAVIGVGLNVRMPASVHIDQPWTDLAQLGLATARNDLAARLLDAMVAALLELQTHGFAAFASRWEALDALLDRDIVVAHDGTLTPAIARGIGADGALRVEVDGRMRLLHSAEVSVRDARCLRDGGAAAMAANPHGSPAPLARASRETFQGRE